MFFSLIIIFEVVKLMINKKIIILRKKNNNFHMIMVEIMAIKINKLKMPRKIILKTIVTGCLKFIAGYVIFYITTC